MQISSGHSPALTATVLITTKDRKEILSRAIESALRQTISIELLVVDDGSTDGTFEYVSECYPDIKIIRNEMPQGIIGARNNAAQVASGDILFTLDDDAEFRTDDVVETVLEDFSHPRVGVVAIPYTNHFPDGRVVPPSSTEGRERGDFACRFYFPGGSNAMRRELFVEMGGYGGTGRQAEEQTYAIRLLDRGYVVRVSSSANIDHYPQRQQVDIQQNAYWFGRNGLTYIAEFVPGRYLPGHLGGWVWNRVRVSWKQGTLLSTLRGMGRGALDALCHPSRRHPIAPATYRLMRMLIASNRPYSEVEPLLPARREV